MISSLKCQDNYEYQLFNQIHKQRDNSIIGVCHRDQHSEAVMVLGHLRVILKEKYEPRTDAWFTQQAIDSARGYYFCSTTGQVIHDDDGEEDDLFAGFCSNISPALAANARAKGEIIEEEYDGNLDDITWTTAKNHQSNLT
jgi:maltooligosyltrehalose synthase